MSVSLASHQIVPLLVSLDESLSSLLMGTYRTYQSVVWIQQGPSPKER
jgi:hypothetical protein